ncbi:MAG: DUF2914 domain-containing protein [Pseudomonadota bacterium]
MSSSTSGNAPQEEEQHSVQEFAEQYVASLAPREDRYETRLGDDFFVCTFPNGLKTWLFVYEVEGYRRRRTLGTYPEMSLTDARDALFSARKLQQAEDNLIARGLGDAVLRGGGPDEARGSRAPAARTLIGSSEAAPALWVRVARTLGAGAVGAALAIGGMFGYATLTTSASGPLARVAQKPSTGQGATAASAAQAPSSATAPASGADTIISEEMSTTAAAAPPSPEQLALEQALSAVSRELLVGEIVNDEPRREVTDTIELADGETRQVYYFTEVRNMVGASLRHRWLHERREVALVPLATPDRWESPLHSGQLLDAASVGTWSIELVDASGALLDFHSFEVILASNDGNSK